MVKLNFFILFLIIIFSCSQKKTEERKIEKIFAYGITLTKESSPKEVANLLIKGLDNEDEELLKKLVAVDYETKEIEKIFKNQGKKAKINKEEVADLTVSGWLLTYTFFEKGKTRVIEEEIEGDFAYVYASGIKPNGKERTIEIRMVKEEGFWKIQAGLKEY